MARRRSACGRRRAGRRTRSPPGCSSSSTGSIALAAAPTRTRTSATRAGVPSSRRSRSVTTRRCERTGTPDTAGRYCRARSRCGWPVTSAGRKERNADVGVDHPADDDPDADRPTACGVDSRLLFGDPGLLRFARVRPAAHRALLLGHALMAYTATNWVEGVTTLGPTNMNKIETELVALDGRVVVPTVVNGQWVKGSGGAAVWAAITAADVSGGKATANKGVANGYASLDASGKVPAAQLPATGAMAKIADVILGAAAANIDFTSIPQTYLHLLIMAQLHTDTTGTEWDNVFGRFNGAADDNYNAQFMTISGTTVTAATNVAQTMGFLGQVHTDFGGVNSAAAVMVIEIPNYTGTTWRKGWSSRGGGYQGSGGTGSFRMSMGEYTLTTTAVTQITLLPSSGNFKTGSRATLYGLT